MIAGLSGRNVCAFCSHGLALRPLYQPPRSKKLHLSSQAENDDYPPPHKQTDVVSPGKINQRWIDSDLMSLGEKLERHLAEAKGPAHGRAVDGGNANETHGGRNTIEAYRGRKTDEAHEVTTETIVSAGMSGAVQTRASHTQQDSVDVITRGRAVNAMVREIFSIIGKPLASEQFRRALSRMREMGEKAVRRVISEQFLRCQTPQEILKTVTVSMQQPWIARQLARSSQPIARSIYRSRNNVTDERALATISVIVLSLKRANLPVHHDLLSLGAKFAARARSLGGMKRFLREMRASDHGMSKSQFRSIIAKMSIGKRGLGEIRNGRWLRRDLLQVLLGFDDPDTERPYHLETFMDREDWMYLHAWITVLARCKAVDQLHLEWELWLANPTRIHEKKLATDYENMHSRNVTSRIRGDYWFIEQMCFAGDIAKSWKILEFSGIPFSNLRPALQSMLLSEPQHATTWNADVQEAMLRKYDEEMTKIEAAVGAEWINTGLDGQGHHVIPGNFDFDNKVWEKFTDPDLMIEELSPPGFPWESDPLVLQAQKELNEAEEIDN